MSIIHGLQYFRTNTDISANADPLNDSQKITPFYSFLSDTEQILKWFDGSITSHDTRLNNHDTILNSLTTSTNTNTSNISDIYTRLGSINNALSKTLIGGSFPASPSAGDIFYLTNSYGGGTFTFNGSSWVNSDSFFTFPEGTQSPPPYTFTPGSLSGFDAYSSTDMSGYQVGMQVIGISGGGTRGAQLAFNWNSEENSPFAGMKYRVNDDTSDTASWGGWSTLWDTASFDPSNYLARTAGGAYSLSGDLHMGQKRVVYLGTPTAPEDATNKTYVDNLVSSSVPSQSGQAGKYLYSNGANTSWQPVTIPDSVPVGSVFYYYGTIPPTGYLVCDGSSFNSSVYSALFSRIGSAVLPDLRDKFIRGNAGRTIGSIQDSANKTHEHIFPGDDFNGGSASFFSDAAAQLLWPGNNTGVVYAYDAQSSAGTGGARLWYTGSSGETESRPINMALLPIIKY